MDTTVAARDSGGLQAKCALDERPIPWCNIKRMNSEGFALPNETAQAHRAIERDPLLDRCLRWLLQSLLVLLALVLPFEAQLFRLGPLWITTVELVLYATVGTWGLSCARRIAIKPSAFFETARAAFRDPMVGAAMAWCVLLMTSALAAPAFRAASVKFALRGVSGVLTFFAVRGSVRSGDARRRILLALLAGAEVSALAAMIDWCSPSSAVLWSAFREGSFDTFGLPRASGVFAYPTMGAMYWEAAIPLCVVAPFMAWRQGPHRTSTIRLAVAVLGSTLLLGAILASATRSGFAVAAAACLLLAVSQTLETRVRRAAAAVLGVLVASCALAFWITGPDSLLGQRLRWWRDEQWFRAEYSVATAPSTMVVGRTLSVPVTVRNRGALTWPRGGDRPVHLGSHWEPLDRRGNRADFEGARTVLAADVPPGGEAKLTARIRGPSLPGNYVLHWDLVQEHTTWFSERGNPTPSQSVAVEGAPASLAETAAEVSFGPPPLPAPRRPLLWRAAIALWRTRPLLGIGPDNFRRSYEDVLSPGPSGQRYEDSRLHANSLYFETLADLGLAGVAVIAAIALALVHKTWSLFKAGRLAGVGFGVAAGAFFVHGLLDYFFEFTPLFGLFWLLLGLTAAAEADRPTEDLPGTPA
jgi:hypothetical protein